MTDVDVADFVAEQLAVWPLARDNHEALGRVMSKKVGETIVMFNPARVASSTAATDAVSVARRRCFLCGVNRPPQQRALPWHDYEILVNPFPIFQGHLTIAAVNHMPQDISGRLRDMVELSRMLGRYTVFFNGARCGASAPDHFHFQAAQFDVRNVPQGSRIIDCSDAETGIADAEAYLKAIGQPRGEMVNIICYSDSVGTLTMVIVPRRCHRPSFYGTGPGEMLLSPASVEMTGYLILTRLSDYEAIDSDIIARMMAEVVI